MGQATPTHEATVEAVVVEEHERLRLDVFLAEMVEDASRTFVQKLIKDGRVRVNGQECRKPSRRAALGDHITATLPPPPRIQLEPEPIPIEVLYEDPELVVVNKPSGLVVHPAPGHYSGTLVNAILFRCPDFLRPGGDPVRPGVVHRLDQYTSGVMVVAKTPRAHACLGEQAAAHRFERRYLALVRGEFRELRGRIDAAIGRSTVDRKRMTVTGIRGKEAVTHFEVLERFGVASLVALQLETGRTHQIRVHLRFAGRPVLGDPVYGVTDFRDWHISPETRAALQALEGQALHAELLGIEHPATLKRMTFTAPPPADFQRALETLRQATAASE
ncbi:MAG: RluA family pseudouridine synthase [Candidatus Hydrogenedentes bacterium]|nr:RluA family pseudouridine synthase [Candidatus Hydrogenedentota bacterium]